MGRPKKPYLTPIILPKGPPDKEAELRRQRSERQPMYVIELTDDRRGIGDILDMLRGIIEYVDNGGELVSLRVGIDPGDNGARFSINWHTWSPPAYGVIPESRPRRV